VPQRPLATELTQRPWLLNAGWNEAQPPFLQSSFEAGAEFGSKSYVVESPEAPSVTASTLASMPGLPLPWLMNAPWTTAFGLSATIWSHVR
jgi:hypothetical protein